MSEVLPLVLRSGQVAQLKGDETLVDVKFPSWDDDSHTFEGSFQKPYADLIKRNEWLGSNEFETFNHGITGNNLFCGAVMAPNGYMYLIPHAHTHVAKLDLSDDSIVNIGANLGAGTFKFNGGCLASNGLIYCTPATHGKSIVIDPEANTVTEIGATYCTTSAQFATAVYNRNGKVYSAPVNRNSGLVINTSNDADYTVNFATSNGAVPSCVPSHDDSNIICIARDSTKSLIWTTSNDALTQFVATHSADTSKWQRGALTPGGTVIVAPLTFNSIAHLILTPLGGAAKITSSDTGSLKFSGVCIGPDGFAYFSSRYYQGIFKVCTRTNVAQWYASGFLINASDPVDKWGAPRLAPNGFIYWPPLMDSRVVKIAVKGDVPPDFYLSRYVNYF